MIELIAQAASPELVGPNPILTALFGIIGLGALVCWILEIVAAFKKEEKPLMGILSIVLCGIGGFVIGWINAKKWGIKNVMIAWSILVVVSIVMNIAFAGALFANLPSAP
jgi:hypothetical protein